MSDELASVEAERDEAIAQNSQLQTQVTQLQNQLANAHPRMAGELHNVKQHNQELAGQLQDARRSVLVEAERDREESERKLRTAAENLRRERDDLLSQTDQRSASLTPEKRDRILAALGVGKQSAQYKRVKTVLDQIMS